MVPSPRIAFKQQLKFYKFIYLFSYMYVSSSIVKRVLTRGLRGYAGQEGLSVARGMTSRGKGVSGTWRYEEGEKGRDNNPS